MEERHYHLRMTSKHVDASNKVAELTLEILADESWTVVKLDDPGMSPFKIFMFSAFVCQNSYLYMNARERGLELGTTRGEAKIRSVDFRLEEIVAEFTSTLRAGEPTDEDATYIADRMLKCPVSRNLDAVSKRTTLHIGPRTATAGD